MGGGVGRRTADFGRRLVQCHRLFLQVVQLQPKARAAKRVGQNQPRTSADIRLVDILHPLGVLGVPHLRRVAIVQPTGKQLCAHRPINDNGWFGLEELVKKVHRSG